ncbi:MAG TPA: rod-binding protein [Candidatus Angelobacter sp.]|nr:rod-binding protein [Candidatus Angelobacter sp.]
MDPIAAKPATNQPAAAQPGAPAIDRNSPAYKSAKEFESVFLGQMVAQMYSGTEAKGPFGGGFAEETYRSLFNQELGRQMSAGGGVGIADAVYAEILKLQGGVK